MNDGLNCPNRFDEIKERLKDKQSLKFFYREVYNKYLSCIETCPSRGLVLELGSGASFAKELIPELITSDIILYSGVDQIIDATNMPFRNNSLKAILLMNTFHHIPNVEKFLKEASRCLIKGGKVFIFDQHHGLLSRFIYKYLHHEPYDPYVTNWSFKSTGPLSDANGALSSIVFVRDFSLFQEKFGFNLRLNKYYPNSPFRYWLSGGLKSWNLLPAIFFPLATFIDNFVANSFPTLCSYVDIELEKIN